MTTAKKTKSLLDLAKEKFASLSEAEEIILQAIPLGKVADCTLGGEANPAALFENAEANAWGENRRVSAALLRWLAISPEARPHIDPQGIRVRGAYIAGILDLTYTDVSFPLAFNACYFAQTPNFSHGCFRMLDFSRSACSGIRVNSAQIDTDFRLTGLESRGTLLLQDTHIGGVLNATGAHLKNLEDAALDGDRISIEGSCFLRDGFSAEGEVRLLGAKIGSNLDCNKGRFVNRDGDALSADRAKIAGYCFLHDGFSAEGKVRLPGAEIDGDLVCKGGSFINKDGDVLNAEHATIGGGAFLEQITTAQGRFNFFRAEIGSLVFRAPPSQAGGFTLDLRQAHCGVLLDNPAAWDACPNYVLSGFRYDSLDNCQAPVKARLGWLRRADQGRYSPQPYEQLAKALRSAGHPDEARDVLIEKERRKPEGWRRDTAMRKAMHYPRRALHGLHGLLVGYGYRPAIALRWVFGLWFLGLLAFGAADDNGAFFPAKDRVYVETAQRCQVSESAKRQEGLRLDFARWLSGAVQTPDAPSCFAMPDAYPRFHAAVYSLDALVPFLDLHQEDYWLPDESKLTGKITAWYLRLHIVLGWVLATFGLAAITGLAKRE